MSSLGFMCSIGGVTSAHVLEMVHCIAFGCCNKNTDIKRGVSFFTLLLKKPDLFKQWLVKLSLKDPPISKHSRVCSEHFTPECFKRDLKAKLIGTNTVRRLKPDVLPTIFSFMEHKAQSKHKEL